MASLNWLWNSAAMRRTLAVMLPTVRKAFGRSLGPMTISATAPITITSPQLMSNMARPQGSCSASLVMAGLDPAVQAPGRVAPPWSGSPGQAPGDDKQGDGSADLALAERGVGAGRRRRRGLARVM